jgi:hypothetical protein
MGKVTNPGDIVEELVNDYTQALGEGLVSILMYGSAVTHEYTPGISDINIAVVTKKNSIRDINRSLPVQKKWRSRRVSVPLFMTRQYIQKSLDTFPVEFLDMQSHYRVVYGEDVLRELDIKRAHLRLQAERELKGAALHLRSGYVETMGNTRRLKNMLSVSLKALIPIFRALLVLNDKKVPASKGDIIMAIEDTYGLGASVLSDIFSVVNKGKLEKVDYTTIADNYTQIIDTLIDEVDHME